MAIRKPRVLMVTGAYYPELAGGSLQCRTLIEALRDRVDFNVLTTTAVPRSPVVDDVDGVPVCRIFVDPSRRRTKLAATWHMTRLAWPLVRRADVVHFHGFTEKMLLLAAIAKIGGRPTIEKLTSLGWDDPVSIRRWPHGRLLGYAQARVDRIVATTPALRARCREAGIPDRIVVEIPNGVDASRFAPVDESMRRALRLRLALPAEACVVVFVGFWSVEKGPHVLFDAWRLARGRAKAATALIFIGSTDASHAEVASAMVERVRADVQADGLGDQVLLINRTDDVASYLQAGDIFVLPSTREGLSNALLEAMATGLACVTVDVAGGTNAVIDNGVSGWTVPAGDVEALARVLERLMSERRLGQTAGTRARQSVLDRFDIRSVADRYFLLYNELASR